MNTFPPQPVGTAKTEVAPVVIVPGCKLLPFSPLADVPGLSAWEVLIFLPYWLMRVTVKAGPLVKAPESPPIAVAAAETAEMAALNRGVALVLDVKDV